MLFTIISIITCILCMKHLMITVIILFTKDFALVLKIAVLFSMKIKEDVIFIKNNKKDDNQCCNISYKNNFFFFFCCIFFVKYI